MARPKTGKLYAIPLCTCGDSQITHIDNEFAEHHGECIVTKCPCIKFTWTPKFELVRMVNPPKFAQFYYGYAENGTLIIGKRVDQIKIRAKQ
jgi:hypothetical protein